MDQSLVHTFSWGNLYGPMVLNVLQKFPLHWYWSMDGYSQGIPKNLSSQVFKKRLLQKSEGNFSNRIPWWILPWIFWWIFSGLFPWKKQEEKIHPKIHGNFQIRIWEFWGQNPHCKDPALTSFGEVQVNFSARILTKTLHFLNKRPELFRKVLGRLHRRRTNVQQLTCKIDLSSSFYYLFFSFVLIELKPFVLKGSSPGRKSMKKCEKL